MKLADGRSDKYAIIGTASLLAAGALCAIPGFQFLAPILLPSIAGIWSSLVLGQKYSDAKTGGATSGYVAEQNKTK